MPRPSSKTTDINAARISLKKALKVAVKLLEDADPQVRLRAVHGVAQAAGVLVRVAEMSDLEARLQALEQALQSSPRMRKIL
jgi:hypothetical protein